MASWIRDVFVRIHTACLEEDRNNTADMTDDLTMALQHDTLCFTRIEKGRLAYFGRRVNPYISHTPTSHIFPTVRICLDREGVSAIALYKG